MVTGIDEAIRTLRDPGATRAEVSDAMGVLLHLAGDIHQPFHVVEHIPYFIQPIGDALIRSAVQRSAKFYFTIWRLRIERLNWGRLRSIAQSQNRKIAKFLMDRSFTITVFAIACAPLETLLPFGAGDPPTPLAGKAPALHHPLVPTDVGYYGFSPRRVPRAGMRTAKAVADAGFFEYCSRHPMKLCSPFLNTIAAAVACAALLMTSCRREEVRVYTVTKEAAPPAPGETRMAAGSAPVSDPDSTTQQAAGPSRQTAPPAKPQLSYTLPAGWQEMGANQMSLVNFRIKTEAGEASVNITPLAGLAGRESAIVNMWREQVGQNPLAESEVAGALAPVEIAGERGQLFEIEGEREGKPLRVVTAFAHRPEGSWFYKLQGPDAVVAAQKPVFVEFLKSVRIKEASGSAGDVAASGGTPGASPPPATPASDAAATSEFKWQVPAGWQALAAGQMQVAKFAVPVREGAKAEVSVSVFPSESGGVLANVNRWRRQLGLDAIDDAGLKDCTSPLAGAPDAVLVDLKNENRRMFGAIVPREGRWWFYKLMGDAPAVEPEREAFVKFAQSKP